MNQLLPLGLILVLSSLMLHACQQDSKSTAESNVEQSKEQENNAGENNVFDQARRSIDALEQNYNETKSGNAQVDMEALKDWIPNRLNGLDRKNREISKTAVMGFNTITASSTYEDDEARVEVEVVHFGGFTGLLSSMAGWANTEIYKEGDDYYEKTIEIDGNKAFVKFDKSNRRGEINLLHEDYIVNITSTNLSERKFNRLPKDLELDKLPLPDKKN